MRTAFLVAACVLCVAASAAAAPLYVPGASNFMQGTEAFALGGPADTTATTQLLFAIRQRTDTLSAELERVSNPRSPAYGAHYSFADMAKFANREGTRAVHRFLAETDVLDVRTSPHGEYVRAVMTVASASKLLGTRFYNFTGRAAHNNGTSVVRCPGYFLPADVAAHVATIGYTVAFPTLRSAAVRVLTAAASSGDQATPKVIAQYYNIGNLTVQTAQASNAVYESNGQSYMQSDIALFDQTFGVKTQSIARVVGQNTPSACSANSNNCDESSLDVQVITSMAQNTETTFWSVPTGEPFLEFANAVASDANPPTVFSISYTDYESQVNSQSVQAFDTEAAKLGLRGVSILVASGDDGVAGASARGNPGACGFNPYYPATPHVTSVGATQGPESGETEIACSSSTNGLITTGGGFSNVFSTPSYQQQAVSQYLQNGPNMPPTSMFNTQGRGYPDIAAMGHNYPTFINGNEYIGSGTSASTPVVAAMITLINAQRIEAGKSTLGFLNHALYQLDASQFNDITSGENNCAAGNPGQNTCCQYGFTASQGWDPLTGRGSVANFENFAAALRAL